MYIRVTLQDTSSGKKPDPPAVPSSADDAEIHPAEEAPPTAAKSPPAPPPKRAEKSPDNSPVASDPEDESGEDEDDPAKEVSLSTIQEEQSDLSVEPADPVRPPAAQQQQAGENLGSIAEEK